MSMPVSVQLYTLRDRLAKDFDGTLAEVAKIGLKYVEFAGFYDRTPAQVRATIDRLGLIASSAHVGLDTFANTQQAVDFAKTIGFKYLILPYVGQEFRSPEGYRKLADQLDDAAARLAPHGISVLYHNHAFEFEKLADGTNGLDVIFNHGKRVQSELDVYWVTFGNADPVAVMKKLSGRVPILHIKDMTKAESRGFSEVGDGRINFTPILAAAARCGVRFLTLEQDSGWVNNDPVESVRRSFNNFKRVLDRANRRQGRKVHAHG